MKRKVLALVAAMAMAFGVMASAPAAQAASCTDGWAYLWDGLNATGVHASICLGWSDGHREAWSLDQPYHLFSDGTSADNRISSISYSSGATVGAYLTVWMGYYETGTKSWVQNNSGQDIDNLSSYWSNQISSLESGLH